VSPIPPLHRPITGRTDAQQNDRLKGACRDFEALFLHTLLKEGRGSQNVSISKGDQNAKDILNDMRDESISREMARSGGVGLGDVLYQELSKQAQGSSENADKRGVRRNLP
jgi:flagellar protein FlgJ